MKRVWPLIVVLFFVQCHNGEKVVTNNQFEDHIRFLASDTCAGRYPGEMGGVLAAEYIKAQMGVAGLDPLSDDGFHSFLIEKGVVPGKNNALKINEHQFSSDSDFFPFSFSKETNLNASLVYVDYGLVYKDESFEIDNYQDLDVEEKVVLIRVGAPEQMQGMMFSKMTSNSAKTIQAREKGASGVIFLLDNDHYLTESAVIAKGRNTGIAAIGIKKEVLDSVLDDYKSNSDNLKVHLQTDLDTLTTQARNVVFYAEGKDSILKNEWIILGAHYDHLGMGGKGSSSRMQDTVAIHYGADDNASGVAAIIEIAEQLAQKETKRSIACMAFDAEEMGLLGSKAVVNDSLLDWTSVSAMINIDMIGRMKSDNTLQIGGVGTSAQSDSLLNVLPNTDSLLLVKSTEGYGPSDHASFYGKDVPVFFFSTGAHLDYHTPFDRFDSINFEGAKSALNYIANLAQNLANSDEKLSFREAGPKTAPESGRHGGGVTLGIMPDFAGVNKNGLRADFVIKGRPAYLGGMKDGDIIVKINSMKISNIDDYMFSLGKLKPGQTIHVEVLRNNVSTVLLIQL